MFKIIKLFLFIFILLLAAVLYEVFSLRHAAKLEYLKQAVSFDVNKGMTVAKLAEELQNRGIIKSADAFRIYSKISDLGAKLQAGEYNLPAGASIEDIIKILSAGQGKQIDKSFLVKEGASIRNIENDLKQNNFLSNNNFAQYADLKVSELPEELKKNNSVSTIPKNKTLEGFLFPDTYSLGPNDDGLSLVKKMLANFEAKLTTEMLSSIKEQKKSLYDVITMASIVEKEVRSTNDMKRAAGVFYNRLAKGQRLESDATLSYALKDDKPGHSLAETALDNPYNTYRNKGLPPGPICNPGIRAIEAAIWPEKHDYYYFLSRSDNGETIWAKTFEEHVKNKQLYLK